VYTAWQLLSENCELKMEDENMKAYKKSLLIL